MVRAIEVCRYYLRLMVGKAYPEPELTFIQKLRSSFILSGTSSVPYPQCYFSSSRSKLRVIDDVSDQPNVLWKENPQTLLPPPRRAIDPPSVNSLWTSPSASFILAVHQGFIAPSGLIFDKEAIYRNGKWYYETPPEGLSVIRHHKIINFIQHWSDGFVHFVFDTLPRLNLAYELLRSNSEIKILVPDRSFILDVLSTLEIEASRIILQDKDAVYGAEVVYFPHFYNNGRPLKMGLMPLGSLDKVKHKLRGPVHGERDKIVYLKRPRRGSRNVENERALLEKIEKRLARNYMLDVFEPSNNWMNDREVMKRAKVVFGPHGGAWSNIIFCDEDTDVIEFLPLRTLKRSGKNERPCFYGLASALGLRYWSVEPDFFEFDKPATKMRVDIEEVLATLHQIGMLA